MSAEEGGGGGDGRLAASGVHPKSVNFSAFSKRPEAAAK